jgi:hypothetical protein
MLISNFPDSCYSENLPKNLIQPSNNLCATCDSCIQHSNTGEYGDYECQDNSSDMRNVTISNPNLMGCVWHSLNINFHKENKNVAT